MMTCQARCLVWTPRGLSVSRTFGVADCAKDIGHADPHTSDFTSEYNHEREVVNGYPTKVTWQHTDRRTFFGPIEECSENDRCVLPDGHGRKHAY